jgi:hypothetical protein
MDVSGIVAIVATSTTGLLGISNIILTYKLKRYDQDFTQAAERTGAVSRKRNGGKRTEKPYIVMFACTSTALCVRCE